MNFGAYLSAARKKKGVSQEELAEHLCVSRQTIYKWEAGITYPDIDKLCDIAKYLGVSTAYLLGEEAGEESRTAPVSEPAAREAYSPDKAQTLHHYKSFARMIGACTWLILASVGALVLLNAFAFPLVEAISVIQLFCCIAVAVVGYVVAGIHHEAFEKQTCAFPFFDKKELEKEQRGFIFRIAAGLALIFAGIIFIVIAAFADIELLIHIAVAALLALIGASVYLFITAGILHDLYRGEEGKSLPKKNYTEPHEAACGVIMLLATAVFLLLGFVWNLWHPAWVAFPIGGLLCGCVSTVWGNKKK